MSGKIDGQKLLWLQSVFHPKGSHLGLPMPPYRAPGLYSTGRAVVSEELLQRDFAHQFVAKNLAKLAAFDCRVALLIRCSFDLARDRVEFLARIVETGPSVYGASLWARMKSLKQTATATLHVKIRSFFVMGGKLKPAQNRHKKLS